VVNRIVLAVVALLAVAVSVQAQVAPPLPAPSVTPLRVVGEEADGRAVLALDAGAYEALRGVDCVEIAGFALGAGKVADLSLVRFDVFAEDARVVTTGDAGDVEGARPDVQLFRGRVLDDGASHVFLALSPHGSSGLIRAHGTTYVISSGRGGTMPTVVYDLASPAGRGINLVIPPCAGAVVPEGQMARGAQGEVGVGGAYQARAYSCRRYRIAIDCDQEFTADLFGGNSASAQAYATMLLAASSEVYSRDTNVTFELAYLRTWTTTDPYTATNTGEQLPQFRSYWAGNMTAVNRSLAHLFSGRSLGGGIAYLEAACGVWGYGVSAELEGFFPYPLQDRSPQNWDMLVVSHELGHNLGTGHTHELSSYNPIIDGCGSNPQDCSQSTLGTIMSYCHTCPGGMTNINLTFPPRVAAAIRGFLDDVVSTCGTLVGTTITQHPASIATAAGQNVQMSIVTAGPPPLAYQWKKGTVNVENDARISGATTSSLSIQGVQSGDAGSYTCVIDTTCGGQVTSNAASLTLTTCPTFTTHPQNQRVTVGTDVVISASVAGATPRTYQWRRNGFPISASARITGVTTTVLRINDAVENDTANYTLAVSNSCGSRVSNPAALTVGPPCGTADFNGDGDFGTDQDIEAFFACLAGTCCGTCGTADFNGDSDFGTDQDIEAFFRVLAGGLC